MSVVYIWDFILFDMFFIPWFIILKASEAAYESLVENAPTFKIQRISLLLEKKKTTHSNFLPT